VNPRKQTSHPRELLITHPSGSDRVRLWKIRRPGPVFRFSKRDIQLVNDLLLRLLKIQCPALLAAAVGRRLETIQGVAYESWMHAGPSNNDSTQQKSPLPDCPDPIQDSTAWVSDPGHSHSNGSRTAPRMRACGRPCNGWIAG
jgi:hypothetical protein